jgi:hypothetical protein
MRFVSTFHNASETASQVLNVCRVDKEIFFKLDPYWTWWKCITKIHNLETEEFYDRSKQPNCR